VSRIAVIGSVNLDLVARVPRLPEAGETLAASGLQRVPGGKGANQALAARRLGADVTMVAAVGDDPAADEALALLRADGVRLERLRREPGESTGHALITVDDAGETTIVVIAGANATLTVTPDDVRDADAVLTVLEIPEDAVADTVRLATGMVVLNAAPARPLDPELIRRVDLVVVNSAEYAAIAGLDAAGAVAVTYGGEGAVLRRGTKKIAVYRDEDGAIHERSAICPHLFCVVDWNPGEKTWDCPCHGSRFDRYGKVVNGPSIVDLPAVDGE